MMVSDLLDQPIPQLLRRLTIPVGTGFFFNTMFNVVDTFYAGLISTKTLAALSLSFPLFFIIVAAGAGILMAGTSLIGHALGAGHKEEAELYTGQVLSFGILHGLALLLAGHLAAPFLFTILGATTEVLPIAVAYMDAIFYGTPFFLANYVFNACLSATGDTKSFRNFLVTGFFLNLALDPWFIYGGMGLPPLGVPGIAWATVLIQAIGNLYLLRRAISSGLISRHTWRLLSPRLEQFQRLFNQGAPATLNMLTVALGIFIITRFVGHHGTAAVAAYGIGTRIEQIVLLPVMGLNIATLSIVSQNFGAGLFSRVHETQRTALKSGLALMVAGSLLVYLTASFLPRLFTVDSAVVAHGRDFLRIEALVLPAYVVLYVNNAALQGLQRPYFALWLGLFRQIAAPIPVFILLDTVLGWNVFGIWWGIFLVTWCAAAVSLHWTRRVVNTLAGI